MALHMQNGVLKMDWSQGFSASYYGCYVDPVTWRDVQRFEIISGSIDRTADELRESATITLSEYEQGKERWVRIYLDTKQNESGAHVPLFTGLAATPGKDMIGVKTEYSLDCYSVLKPAQDILLQRGWYAPVETASGTIIKNLLSGFAPVEIANNSPLLSQAIIAEDDETNLSMAEKIIKAIGWRIKIDGNGTINVIPKPIDLSATFDSQTNDVIEPKVSYTHDWFDCPNCFRAVSDDLMSVAKDESLSSPLSVPNRGREVWAQEDSVDLADDESIAEYAVRQLKELQAVATTVTYSRRYDPEVYVGDLVRLKCPTINISGVFSVLSQSVELGYSARVTEEVKYEADY